MEVDSADSSSASSSSQGKGVNKQVAHQGVAVLGIALVAMGEDIGAEMCFRSFGHLVSGYVTVTATVRSLLNTSKGGMIK